jgi:hypothetical protein
MLMYSLEDTLVAPAGKPLVDTVPFAAIARKQPLLGTTLAHPKECFDEPAATTLLSNVEIWTGAKKREDLYPHVVLECR